MDDPDDLLAECGSGRNQADQGATAADASTARTRLDTIPLELRNMLVEFVPLEMRTVLALVPQFRIRSDDVLRSRKRLCEWAAEYGYLGLLKWAHEHNYPLLQLRDGKDACASAARGGHLAVLQWLREQKCRWDATACYWAAERGHLEVLQWLHERGCEWNMYTTTAAAEGGHLHVLQWLLAHGCQWNIDVTLTAAENQRWEVLEWALANGCHAHPTTATAVICCGAGDRRMFEWATAQQIFVWLLERHASGLTLDVLRYLKENRPGLINTDPDLADVATAHLARAGDLAGLEWARENGCFNPNAVWNDASEGGQLAVLKWAAANEFPNRDSSVCENLAAGGHLECLKWAVANGHRPDARACTTAAATGQLWVLQWLREEASCEWNGDVLAKALDCGHWAVFEWARQHGCPVNARVFEAVICGGYADLLQWAFEVAAGTNNPTDYAQMWCSMADNVQVLKVLRHHGFTWTDNGFRRSDNGFTRSESTCVEFARRGDLELLQWAHRNGCRWDEWTCIRAWEEGNYTLLQWAVENGCPMNEDTQYWWNGYDPEQEFRVPIEHKDEK